ncbi:MAG: DUF4249 domain-containing protein [Chitinophagaceae bacterium]|nr:DUF4249 domain-containing protein [Chitinophagaceae bacterium]
MKTVKKVASITIAALLFITACKKDITINFPADHNSKVFIEGMLYPGKKPQIFISKSNPFFSSNVSPQQVFARRAVVKITSGTTVDVLVQDSIFNKFRCRWEPFYRGNIPAQYGKTYTLEVNYDGNIYTASTTINQKAVAIESIEYTAEFFDVYGGHDGVILKITDPPGTRDYYRFQMNRMIDSSVRHAHVLDKFINTCVSGPDEKFPVTDIGRIVFTDENADGQKILMSIEVTHEYEKGDKGWIFIQSLDRNSAEFYKDLDDQLQAIKNPFVEPVFINTKIPGAMGVFGSAVLSDSVLFVYPRDHP